LFEEPLEFGDEIWRQKTRVLGLPDDEEIMPLAFFVLTQFQRVTVGRTDGRTDTLRSLLPVVRRLVCSTWRVSDINRASSTLFITVLVKLVKRDEQPIQCSHLSIPCKPHVPPLHVNRSVIGLL